MTFAVWVVVAGGGLSSGLLPRGTPTTHRGVMDRWPARSCLELGHTVVGLLGSPCSCLYPRCLGLARRWCPMHFAKIQLVCGSARLFLELFNLIMQLAHGLVGRLVDVGLSLSCVA